jgi:hypothetical protein
MKNQMFNILSRPAKVDSAFESPNPRLIIIHAFLWYVFLILFIFLLRYIDRYSDLPPHKAFVYSKKLSVEAILLIGLIVAPLLEEAAFRLGLKFSRMNLAFSSAFLFYILVSRITKTSIYALEYNLLWKYVCTAAFLLGSFFLLGRKRVASYLGTFWRKRYALIYYASVMLFTLLHIGNLKDLKQYDLWIIPVLVLPQFYMAMVLSHVRVRTDLVHSVSLHSLMNILPVVIMVLAKISV